ncbi:hypothetical protein BJ508DRAFT_316457, partial [Ascobolus immersus RN42]
TLFGSARNPKEQHLGLSTHPPIDKQHPRLSNRPGAIKPEQMPPHPRGRGNTRRSQREHQSNDPDSTFARLPETHQTGPAQKRPRESDRDEPGPRVKVKKEREETESGPDRSEGSDIDSEESIHSSEYEQEPPPKKNKSTIPDVDHTPAISHDDVQRMRDLMFKLGYKTVPQSTPEIEETARPGAARPADKQLQRDGKPQQPRKQTTKKAEKSTIVVSSDSDAEWKGTIPDPGSTKTRHDQYRWDDPAQFNTPDTSVPVPDRQQQSSRSRKQSEAQQAHQKEITSNNRQTNNPPNRQSSR